MLFLRCLLHPTLMVIGMFMALVIFIPVGHLLGGFFKIFVASLSGGGVGPIGMVVFIMILCVMIIITAHKIFGLVTWMPQNVMGWIGQLGKSLGEEGDANQANTTIVGGLASGGRSVISGSKPALKTLPGTGGGGGDAAGDAAKKKLDSQLAMGSTDTGRNESKYS